MDTRHDFDMRGTVAVIASEATEKQPPDPASLIVRRRLEEAKVSYLANDNIAEWLHEGELEKIEAEVEQLVGRMIDALVIDRKRDHNTRETAARVARMMVRETFRGRYEPMPKVTDFPNAKKLDEIYTVGPLTVRSTCSHHLVPIIGEAWVGVIPGERVIGLSKFGRLIHWMMARPHIQEEAVVMLADTLEQLIRPKGLAVVLKAQHLCMTARGIQEPDATMTNSVLRGIMMHSPAARDEFFSIIKAQGF